MKLTHDEKRVRFLLAISVAIAVIAFGLFFFRFTDTLDATFDYSVNADGSITIKGYSANPKTLTIPDEIDGKPVRHIAPYAFGSHDSELKKVILPEGIETIGERAFADITTLKTVELPSTLKEIGRGAFMNCAELQNIDLPVGLTTLDAEVFDGCIRLSSLKIPASVTAIGVDCFASCESLKLDVSENPLAAEIAEQYRIETGKVDSVTLTLVITAVVTVIAVALVFVGIKCFGKYWEKRKGEQKS